MMNSKEYTLPISTKGFTDVVDLTPAVSEKLRASGIKNGLVTVFIPGSTAGVTTIEYESGVVEDLRRAIDRLAPQNLHYDHDAQWGDGNGFAHVRASLLGPSLTVPCREGKMLLGTWQQIILVDFDNRPRDREVIVQVQGD
jgi:secondary thiamine-phosphate synthase enzyme